MTEKTELEQWFSIARDDLLVASRCYADFVPKQLSIACYHSQQCAEKALKGFLHSRNIDPPKIHDLSLLCAFCIEQDQSFNEIYEASSKLTVYGVITRYPKEIFIDEATTETVIHRAWRIFKFCLEKVPELNDVDFPQEWLFSDHETN